MVAGAGDLVDRTGALLATSLVGKGLFAGQEWDVGISGVFASAVTEELLGEADLILGIGAEVGYHTSEGGLMFPSAQIARIDIKPAKPTSSIDLGVHSLGLVAGRDALIYVPKAVAETVLTAPFNDLDAVRRELEAGRECDRRAHEHVVAEAQGFEDPGPDNVAEIFPGRCFHDHRHGLHGCGSAGPHV